MGGDARPVMCPYRAPEGGFPPFSPGVPAPGETGERFLARGENVGAPPKCGPVRRREVGAGLRPAPTEARHRALARPRPKGQGRILSRGQFIGLQLSFVLTFPLANCFWWEPAGRSPAGSHQKLFLCTGRERRNPAKVRTRPPPIRVHLSTSVSYAGIFHSPRRGLFPI